MNFLFLVTFSIYIIHTIFLKHEILLKFCLFSYQIDSNFAPNLPIQSIILLDQVILVNVVVIYHMLAVLQDDRLNMAVCLWSLVKSDLSSLKYCTRVHSTILIYRGTRATAAIYNWSPCSCRPVVITPTQSRLMERCRDPGQ